MIITFGEILLRLSTPNAQRLSQSTVLETGFGGAEANVAASLSLLGHQVGHITRLPDNELGRAATQMLTGHKIQIDHILYGGTRMGLYFLESGAGHRASQVIYDRSGSSMAEAEPGMFDWDTILKDATWFHWSGITPAISASAASVCMEAIDVAAKKGIPISVDLNYRAKLWQYGKKPSDVLPEMLKHADFLFGGIDAPEKMFGIVPEDRGSTRGELLETDLISISEQMLKKFPKARMFASTLRWIKSTDHHKLQGMIYTRQNRELYLASVYDMPQMVDRIGGGDAFMAGFIHGLIKFENDFQKIVNFATAASVLKHYTAGDVNLSSAGEIENIMQGQGMSINR